MADEVEFREAIDAISKKKHGKKALEILDVVTYLAPQNIHIEIFSSLVNDGKQLTASIQLLHQHSIVHYNQDKTVFDVHKTAKKVMLTIHEKENRKLQVLKKVTQLLHPNKYDVTPNRVDHYLSVWGYLKPYSHLIELYSEVPKFISIDMGKMSKYSEAISFATESWDLLCSTIGERHRNVVTLRFSIAKLYADDGRHEDALTLLFAVMLEVNPENSDPEEMRNTIFLIATELCEMKRYDEALDIYQQIILTEVFETDNPKMLLNWCQYAEILGKTGRCFESAEVFRKVLQRGTQIKYFTDNDALIAKYGLATALAMQSKHSEALELYHQICESRVINLGENHPETLEVNRRMASILERQGKSKEASAIINLVIKKDDVTNELKAKTNLKLEPICSAAKRGNLNKVKTLVKSGVDINKQDDSQKTPLHYAAAHNHMNVVKFLLQQGAIYNHKDRDGKTPSQITDYSKIKSLLDSVETFIKYVKEGNCEKASEHISEEKVILNARDNHGCNSLHWAAHNGHEDSVKLLLEIGADATQVTSKGNTPLHIATSKGHREIVEILLRHTKHDELNAFINAQTFRGGVTAIHVAAKNGFLDTVKCLLKYGAIYNVRNKEGETPLEISKDRDVINLLKPIDKLFEYAKNGNLELVSRLRAVKPDEFIALTGARNHLSNTLLQVTVANQHENVASKLSKKCESPSQTCTIGSSSQWTLDKIKKCKRAAEVYMKLSSERLLVLRSLTKLHHPEQNPHPFVTFLDGSYYLSDVHHFVGVYKSLTRGSIDDENVQRVNDTLVELEFDPNHIVSDNKDLQQFHHMLEDPDFKPITCTEDEGNDVEEIHLIDEWFASNGQGTKYFKMLHSESKRDVKLFLNLVEREIEMPVRQFLESMEQRLQYVDPEKFLKAIQDNDYLGVEFRIRAGADINSKNPDGRTPLHYAVNNGDLAIVNILLENGADVTQATVKGNTPLHTATTKGLEEIIKVLLKNVSHDKFKDFVNAKTTVEGTTALHVAAKNGSLEIVKILFSNGAFHNVKNSEGKTPLDLTEDRNIANLLKLTSELFQHAKDGDSETIDKLQDLKSYEFAAVTNARDIHGETLLQVMIANNREYISSRFLEMLKRPNQIRPSSSPEWKFDQIERLKKAAECYIKGSESYLRFLRNTSQLNRSEKNSLPWATLKAGSHYLEIAHSLVEEYKICAHGSITDRNIRVANDTLVELEFDPKHITLGYTDEAYDGKVACFVSKGQGTKYYELLHSVSKKDVKHFVELVRPKIDDNIKRFSESMKQKFRSFLSKMLFVAIENNDHLEVENCIKEEGVIDLKDQYGRTPLLHAADNTNLEIIYILLKNGADVTLVGHRGQTVLHIASSQGQIEIVEPVLEHVDREKMNDFINAKVTGPDGLTGTTALHAAAGNDMFEVVKCLLTHGAIYNLKDADGKTPLDYATEQNITNLLKLVQILFKDAKTGNTRMISKLKASKLYEFTAVTNTRNEQGQSLIQVARFNKHETLVGKLEMMIKSRSVTTGH